MSIILSTEELEKFNILLRKEQEFKESSRRRATKYYHKHFKLNDNNTDNILIRATQGHNIKKINPDKIYDIYTKSLRVIHGTTLKHLMSILIDENILSQNRNEVHFALGYLDETLEDGTKVKSGMRKSSTI